MARIKELLEGLKGGAYFDAWADWWATNEADPIRADVQELIDTNQLTPISLFRIREKHELPWKTFVEQLEKDGVLKTGIYDKLPSLDGIRKEVARRIAECQQRADALPSSLPIEAEEGV